MRNDENNLFIGSLSYDTTDDSLREYFETIGPVTNAKVIRDRETDRSRGFGFVAYETEEDMRKAIEELHDTELDGWTIRVSQANPRT